MRETIILAPGANASELLRSLARFGSNTIGHRIVSSVELARTALMRSGISTSEEFLPAREEPSLVFSFIRDIPYFSTASYKDAEALAVALSTARKLITADEAGQFRLLAEKGEFRDKNEALEEAYRMYMTALRNRGKTDGISLIRKAISEARPIDADFRILREFPITPLDKELLEKVSDGRYEEMGLPCLYGKECGGIKPDGFTRAYGAINEAEDIIGRIYRNAIPLDRCVVACANADTYGQVFYDLSRRYGIPMTFGSGIGIGNSNPAELTRLLLAWNTSGYNGVDSLRRVLSSSAFDRSKLEKKLGAELKRPVLERIVKMAGYLRLSFDPEENAKRLAAMKDLDLRKTEWEDEKETLGLVEKLADVLELGYTGILEEYCVMRHGDEEKVDQSGLSVIVNGIRSLGEEADEEEVLPDLLNKTVSSGNSREGALHICTICGAMSVMRSNLFVCGLSSEDFPGNPAENHLLLDSDLELLDRARAVTSVKRVRENRDSLDLLLREAAAVGASVYLSYPDFDLAGIKEQNPSSWLLDLYEGIYPGEEQSAHFDETGFFESALSPSDAIGGRIAEGAEIAAAPDDQKLPDAADRLGWDWSPTALELFFQCPRHFYLRYIAGIREEEEDDPFTVISAADEGTLVHELMERSANKAMNADEFKDMSSRAFDEFLVRRPPIHPEEAGKKKRQFLEMMDNAFAEDPRNYVISAEHDYRFTHQPSGITVKGKPDRVEKSGDEKYLVADYKTKRKTDHKNNDIDTCLQVVLYSWLSRQAGFDVTKAEYRYLRLRKTVTCDINDLMLSKLDAKLSEFRNAMVSNEFPRDQGKNKENCRYCKFKDICNWDGEEEVNDEDE